MWLRETIQHTVSTYSHLLIGRLGNPVHHLIDILKEALPTSDITPNLKATKMSLYGRIPELQSAQESCLSATAAGLITFWHKDFSSPNFHYLHILFYTNQATAKHTSMSPLIQNESGINMFYLQLASSICSFTYFIQHSLTTRLESLL